MLSKRFKIILVMFGLFAIQFSKVNGMQNDQEDDIYHNEVNLINKENKFLSNKEKANKYNSIFTYESSGFVRFCCKYWDKLNLKMINLCSDTDFGKCVIIARHHAKNDKTIPEDIAQLKSENSINKSTINKLHNIYLWCMENRKYPSGKSYNNEERSHHSFIKNHKKQFKNNENTAVVDLLQKILSMRKNIPEIIPNLEEKLHSKSEDKEDFVDAKMYETRIKRKRNENNVQFYPDTYITISRKTAISSNILVLADINTQFIPMGTSLQILRIVMNDAEGIIRGQLADNRWISIKELDPEKTWALPKPVLDDLFEMLHCSNPANLYPMFKYLNEN